jgi:hypothetical protein
MNLVIGNADMSLPSKDEGFVVGAFRGSNGSNASNLQEREIKRFENDFHTAFTNAVNGVNSHIGLLLKYSYFDTDKSAWGGLLDFSQAPWDALSTASDTYSHFGTEEVRAINIGIREGILESIPENVHYLSFGPGATSAFKNKDGKILTGLVGSGHQIHGATTIDINKRYALDNAQVLYDAFGFDAMAIQGDFFSRDFFSDTATRLNLDEGATPLIAIFGGTVQNTPQTPEESTQKGITTFFTKMGKAFPGAHVIMTVDATIDEIDPSIATAPYQYSLENEIFVLNFMARAKQQGVIKDPKYEILRNWKIADPAVWTGHSVDGYIEAKRDHLLETTVGTFDIKAGTRVSVSTSRKERISDYINNLSAANFTDIEYHPQSRTDSEAGSSKYIIHAIAQP